eukprot:Seg2294.2 transcript_id=Seg2294.2/GoldUCD/mRNA.D3Y31 product="N-lysine methyltransferase KMT5A-A" protein_id=Seg2294.2/GoldUCD/D3Y31
MAQRLRSSRCQVRGEDHNFKPWLKEDQPGLEAKFVEETIGMGVYTSKPFKKGCFLLHYSGELISREEAEWRERHYKKSLGSYMYFFSHEGNIMCIDATNPDGRLGRLVNDSAKPNCVMRKKLLSGVPLLCLYALEDLESNTELRYDYGVNDLPWRGEKKQNMNISKKDPSKAVNREKANNLHSKSI